MGRHATRGSVARSRHSGDFHTQLENALESLDAALARAGSNLSNLVRLEVYLRDIYNADRAADMLRARLRTDPPALAIIGAELGAPLEVNLNAIAV